MSGKRLLPLAAILVVLVVVALTVKRQPTPTRLVDEVGWERLVPDSLQADSITGVDLYQGILPDQVLSLRRQGDRWQVQSYFDAPVRPSRIELLLEQIGGLEGELRADRAELLGEFDLEEEQALHLRVYTNDETEPALHLLAGRSGRRSGFVRLAGRFEGVQRRSEPAQHGRIVGREPRQRAGSANVAATADERNFERGGRGPGTAIAARPFPVFARSARGRRSCGR